MADDSLDALWRATDYKAVACLVLDGGFEKREEWWAPCPSCGAWDPKDPTFSVSLTNGVSKCFKCSATGNLITLAKAKFGSAWKAEWVKASPACAEILGVRASRAPAKAVGPTPADLYAKARFGEEAVAPLAAAWRIPATWLVAHKVVAFDGGFGFPVFDLATGEILDLKRRLLPPIPEGEKKSKTAYGGKAGLFGGGALLDQPARTVVVVEGEKDWAVTAHALPGMCVIGISAGAGCWRPEWTEALRGRDVVLALDADEAGEAGAAKARDLLAGVAKRVRRLAPLFDAGPLDAKGRKTWPDGMDLFDALRGSATPIDVAAAIEAAPEYKAPAVYDLEATVRGLIADLDDPDADAYLEVGNTIAALMTANGARWFMDAGEPCVGWGKRVYRCAGADAHWVSLLSRWTGLSDVTSKGRVVFRALQVYAKKAGAAVRDVAWCAARPGAVYMALNDDAGRNVKITAESIEVVDNFTDGVVTVAYEKARPITVLPDADFDSAAAFDAWYRTCSFFCTTEREQTLLAEYALTIPLYPMIDDHPVIRFRGDQQSGKSMAAKAITTLLVGEADLLIEPTTASLYRQSSRRPVTCYDNLEEGKFHGDRELEAYLLISATGASREKSMMNDSHGVIEHRVRSLLLTTGIEPIGTTKPEVTSRTIEVNFHAKHRTEGFEPKTFLARVAAERDLVWNAAFRYTQDALRAAKGGRLRGVVRSMPKDKTRLTEWWAWLSMASCPSATTASEAILGWVGEKSDDEARIDTDDNALIGLLQRLPSLPWERSGIKWEVAGTKRRTGSIYIRALHAALCSLARDTGMEYPCKTNGVLGARLSGGQASLKAAGISFLRKRDRGGSVIELEVSIAPPSGPSELPFGEKP